MPVPSDVRIERIPLDGRRSLEESVQEHCKNYASLNRPRKLAGVATINTVNGQEVILFFELV